MSVKLFDIIVDQLLSGVRLDGRKINFLVKTLNGAVYQLSQMRLDFNEAVDKNKEVFLRDRTPEQFDELFEKMNDITSTIPILAECVSTNDINYFENQIIDYVLKLQEAN